MNISLTCNECKQSFHLDAHTLLSLERCPRCKREIRHQDEQPLLSIAESVVHNAPLLHGIALNGIYPDSPQEADLRSMSDLVFCSDLAQFSSVYQRAPLNVRKELKDILDYIYMLTIHAADCGDIDSLQVVKQYIWELWHEKVMKNNTEL